MNVAGSLANQYGQIGQQQYGAGQALAGAQTGYGGFLSGLGGQAQQAAQQDVASCKELADRLSSSDSVNLMRNGLVYCRLSKRLSLNTKP
jgi:hypothetical protein